MQVWHSTVAKNESTRPPQRLNRGERLIVWAKPACLSRSWPAGRAAAESFRRKTNWASGAHRLPPLHSLRRKMPQHLPRASFCYSSTWPSRCSSRRWLDQCCECSPIRINLSPYVRWRRQHPSYSTRYSTSRELPQPLPRLWSMEPNRRPCGRRLLSNLAHRVLRHRGKR